MQTTILPHLKPQKVNLKWYVDTLFAYLLLKPSDLSGVYLPFLVISTSAILRLVHFFAHKYLPIGFVSDLWNRLRFVRYFVYAMNTKVL